MSSNPRRTRRRRDESAQIVAVDRGLVGRGEAGDDESRGGRDVGRDQSRIPLKMGTLHCDGTRKTGTGTE
jgi:hypothetical protein